LRQSNAPSDIVGFPTRGSWFDHDPTRFAEFRARYRSELPAEREGLEKLLRARAQAGPVTVLYAARDHEHNNAIVLAELLCAGES